MKNKEHIILNNRYMVIIGSRGGVKVYGKASYRSKEYKRELTIHGKGKDRYVMLKPYTEYMSHKYLLTEIKAHILYGTMLFPCVSTCDNNTYLKDPSLIQQLPKINGVYISCEEEQMITYDPIYLTNKSNGFLVAGYNVVGESNGVTQSLGRTGWHKVLDKITITDLENVKDEDLEGIFKLINDERIKRKLEQFQSDFRKAYPSKYKEESLEYKVYQEDRLNS